MPVPAPHEMLLSTATTMRAAAQRGDWGEVERLEAFAHEQMQRLKTCAVKVASSPEGRHLRRSATLAALRLDAQIRSLAEPGWMAIEECLSPGLRGKV